MFKIIFTTLLIFILVELGIYGIFHFSFQSTIFEWNPWGRLLFVMLTIILFYICFMEAFANIYEMLYEKEEIEFKKRVLRNQGHKVD